MIIYQVDSFTEKPFKGNPAGVCVLNEEKNDIWMLELAREINLSETAFLLKSKNGYFLRWFTPKNEVSLCGHATLASAHVLWEERLVSCKKDIRFETRGGILIARKDGSQIQMDFPARILSPSDNNKRLNQSLRVNPIFTGKYNTDTGELFLIEVESDSIVKKLKPDYQALLSTGIRSVIVTARSSKPEYDFITRYFAPAIGVNEDPVTGSAHCYLAPYWGERLKKDTMVGFQASGRSGIVICNWTPNKANRVFIGGNAVTIFKIDLLV